MNSVFVASVRYLEGHSYLGERTINVNLVAYPSNLSIFDAGDNQPLFSIPWANFSSAQTGYAEKRGLGSGGAFVLRTIPGLDLLGAADPFHDGVRVIFWDEEIQRTQNVFFATRSKRKARELMQVIYQYRDNYHRTLGKGSRPQQKK
ncbi:MAG: hypothetical protein H6634_13390 [Anaerolineales bacterium]|nr:hypothetical protein [Anaerolineales bacterium]